MADYEPLSIHPPYGSSASYTSSQPGARRSLFAPKLGAFTPVLRSPSGPTTSTTPLPNPLPAPRSASATTPQPPAPTLAVSATSPRIVLAVDYGTTYTGVAYLQTTGRDNLKFDEIRVVTRWPKSETRKVPSRISYSPSKTGCTQWGHDLDDGSRVMTWTKLELEQNKNRTEELDTLCELFYGVALLDFSNDSVIYGDIPHHLAKEAEDIVRDYLDEVAETTLEDICNHLGRHVPEQIAIDMVVTHPAKWSDSALNSTFRAVSGAFNSSRFPKLRSISFVSEPEACAHHTLHAAQSQDRGRLKRDDCFIVVDAGGGTVDLAAFKVTSIDSSGQFQLERVGYITGDKCGATCIDRNFEDFLEERLPAEDWKELKKEGQKDAGSGGHTLLNEKMRQLHTKFEPIKHEFKGDSGLAKSVDLPLGIGEVDDAQKGVENGQIRITTDDLKKMFKTSVDKTLILVHGQITQIKLKGLKVKSIFLSGGFASSEYLYRRMAQFGSQHRITVERGVDCWTAVARGAVLQGLGICSEKPVPAKGCPRHYGIKTRTHFAPHMHRRTDTEVDIEGIKWATDQIRWLVRKGDVIHPDRPTMAKYECHWTMKESVFLAARDRNRDPRAAAANEVFRDVVVVTCPRQDAPTRFADITEDDDSVVTLRCDLTEVPKSQTATFANKQSGRYMKFWVTVDVSISDKVRLSITSGGKELASSDLDL